MYGGRDSNRVDAKIGTDSEINAVNFRMVVGRAFRSRDRKDVPNGARRSQCGGPAVASPVRFGRAAKENSGAFSVEVVRRPL